MAKKEERNVASEAVEPEFGDAETSVSSKVSQRQWSSQELFGVEREVLITHGDDVYRLRKTRNGKLILHK